MLPFSFTCLENRQPLFLLLEPRGLRPQRAPVKDSREKIFLHLQSFSNIVVPVSRPEVRVLSMTIECGNPGWRRDVAGIPTGSSWCPPPDFI